MKIVEMQNIGLVQAIDHFSIGIWLQRNYREPYAIDLTVFFFFYSQIPRACILIVDCVLEMVDRITLNTEIPRPIK